MFHCETFIQNRCVYVYSLNDDDYRGPGSSENWRISRLLQCSQTIMKSSISLIDLNDVWNWIAQANFSDMVLLYHRWTLQQRSSCKSFLCFTWARGVWLVTPLDECTFFHFMNNSPSLRTVKV